MLQKEKNTLYINDMLYGFEGKIYRRIFSVALRRVKGILIFNTMSNIGLIIDEYSLKIPF